MSKEQKNKGISRIDSGSTHGWFVRGYRNGKTYSKLFSDKKWGGPRKALAAARDYRDELSKELEKIPALPRGRRIVYRDSRNKTGVLGVCRSSKVSPNGKVTECYTVSWRPEPGVQKCTSFSINKYGEKGAFELAVQHRKNKMREIYGDSVFRRVNKRMKEESKKSGVASPAIQEKIYLEDNFERKKQEIAAKEALKSKK